jgi:hypothetical protein
MSHVSASAMIAFSAQLLTFRWKLFKFIVFIKRIRVNISCACTRCRAGCSRIVFAVA